MKTKDQKRREAIQRLENPPRWNGLSPEPPEWVQEKWTKRMEEATRLRRAFGYEQRS